MVWISYRCIQAVHICFGSSVLALDYLESRNAGWLRLGELSRGIENGCIVSVLALNQYCALFSLVAKSRSFA